MDLIYVKEFEKELLIKIELENKIIEILLY